MLTIEPESSEDHAAIRRVTIDAFSGAEFGHQGEAELIEALRENCREGLSLVAHENGALVGHILFTPVVIRSSEGELHGMGLAPLSVAPALQRKGVGSALVRAGLEQLAAAGTAFTAVAGHPAFYPRFDFTLASRWDIRHGFEGMSQEAFFVHAEDPTLLDTFRGGEAYYRPEFGAQHVCG